METIGVACKTCFTTLLVWSTAHMSSIVMMAIVDELWLGGRLAEHLHDTSDMFRLHACGIHAEGTSSQLSNSLSSNAPQI